MQTQTIVDDVELKKSKRKRSRRSRYFEHARMVDEYASGKRRPLSRKLVLSHAEKILGRLTKKARNAIYRYAVLTSLERARCIRESLVHNQRRTVRAADVKRAFSGKAVPEKVEFQNIA